MREGRALVANPQAQEVKELFTANQNMLQAHSLDFGVPMSLVVSGDATGKATLNGSSGPTPETARRFTETLRALKETAENWCMQMHLFMYEKARGGFRDSLCLEAPGEDTHPRAAQCCDPMDHSLAFNARSSQFDAHVASRHAQVVEHCQGLRRDHVDDSRSFRQSSP
jgi:hypothetical protein